MISDSLLSSEQTELRALARQVADEKFGSVNADWERAGVVDFDYLKATLREVGFLGMTIAPEYGGAGAQFLDFILVMEQMARVSNAAAFFMQATSSGPVSHIIKLGSPGIKAEILPRIVDGTAWCAIAISEANAGSDWGAIQTRIRDVGDDEVEITGTKMWVGGGGGADYYVTYARGGDDRGTAGLACVVIPASTPGLEFGSESRFLGTRGVPRREMILSQCRVPRGNVLVPVGGFKQIINEFNGERIHNATFALGIATGAYEHALEHARSREQFGRPLAANQGIQWKLADMAVKLEAMRLLVYGAAREYEAHSASLGLSASMAKLFATETGCQVVDAALQIEGATGYCEGVVESAYRNVRAFRIAAGTSEMLLNYIGRSITGVPRS
jgi:alkylation response protein AidB-like acyl-CoA dehydrogenase